MCRNYVFFCVKNAEKNFYIWECMYELNIMEHEECEEMKKQKKKVMIYY